MTDFPSENDALKARVAELEVEVAKLRSCNDELQRFAYASSHDLKAPLRTIASFSELLAKRYQGKLDRDADEFIEFILSAARKMEKLIVDVLVYSRMLNAAAPPQGQVDLQAAVNWVMMNVDSELKATGGRFECGPMPTVPGDQQQILQLLQHLFSNALRFRSERPLDLRFNAQERSEDVLLALSDNGIGFDMKYSEQIFAPFKRLHSQDVPGSGLGLAIGRKIVERHGGRIWAESIPGEGSTFYFTLPV